MPCVALCGPIWAIIIHLFVFCLCFFLCISEATHSQGGRNMESVGSMGWGTGVAGHPTGRATTGGGPTRASILVGSQPVAEGHNPTTGRVASFCDR